MNIPECIFHKIILYNSHPVADLMKNVFDEYSFDFDYDETLYGKFYSHRKKIEGNLEFVDDNEENTWGYLEDDEELWE